MDELYFELDLCTAFNMLLGKSFEDAELEARTWVKEQHESIEADDG